MTQPPRMEQGDAEVSCQAQAPKECAAGAALAPAAPDDRNAPWLVNLLGWIGTFLIVGAYALLSWGAINQGLLYQSLNLLGSLGLGLICWYRRTWQPFWLQVIWALVAATSILSIASDLSH